jgi:hypothetical protein
LCRPLDAVTQAASLALANYAGSVPTLDHKKVQANDTKAIA